MPHVRPASGRLLPRRGLRGVLRAIKSFVWRGGARVRRAAGRSEREPDGAEWVVSEATDRKRVTSYY